MVGRGKLNNALHLWLFHTQTHAHCWINTPIHRYAAYTCEQTTFRNRHNRAATKMAFILFILLVSWLINHQVRGVMMTDTTVTPQTLLHTVLYLIVDYFSRSIDVHACALHVVNKMSTPVTNTCAKASLKYFQNVSDSFPVIQQVYLC